MATQKQKTAARRNIKRARGAQSSRARGAQVKRRTTGLSTRQQNRMPAQTFAFPKERKEPLNDARHVRNAIARFDQVEGVSDSEREAAWRRIRSAARKHGVDQPDERLRTLLRTAGERPGERHADAHQDTVVAVEPGRDQPGMERVGRHARALETAREFRREEDVGQLGFAVAGETGAAPG